MSKNKKLLLLLLTAFALVFSGLLSAQESTTLGESATKVTDQIPQFAKLALFAGYLGGIAFVVIGIFKYVGHKKKNEPMGDSVPYILGGFLLIGVLWFITAGTGSMGGGKDGIEELQLGTLQVIEDEKVLA